MHTDSQTKTKRTAVSPLVQSVQNLENGYCELSSSYKVQEQIIKTNALTISALKENNQLLKQGIASRDACIEGYKVCLSAERQRADTWRGMYEDLDQGISPPVKEPASPQGLFIVSARELYQVLGFHIAQWKRWYEKNILTNPFATEGVHYRGFNIMLNGNETMDFMLTMDFAKKLSMMARTQNGEAVREYFIRCEEAARNNTAAPASPIQVLTARMDTVEQEVDTLYDDYLSIAGYAALRNLNIDSATAQRIGRLVTQSCKTAGWAIGWQKHPIFGRVSTYPRFEIENTIKSLNLNQAA